MEDPALKRWLDGIRSKNTHYGYKSAFRTYFEYCRKNATELINEANEDAKLRPLERKEVVINRLLGYARAWTMKFLIEIENRRS